MSRATIAIAAPAKPARAAPAPRARAKSASGLASTMAAVNVVMTEDRQEIKPRKGTGPKKPKAKTREGKKGLVLYLDPAIPSALRRLAALLDRDVQALGQEALALLFAKYEAHAPTTGNKRVASPRTKGA